MTVFGTEMHIATFIFVAVECIFFVQQSILHLLWPSEKKRLYYLILLGLLIIYNVAGGLFPDPNFSLPLKIQMNLAYGSGFFMGAFFPYYFYKAYDMDELKWQAKYGVWLFLILPFFLFFSILYPLSNDLPKTIWYGLAIPLAYAFFLVYKILASIREKFRDKNNSLEAILTYAAMCPWALLPLFSYIDTSQFVEVIFTNCGFIIITFLFLKQVIYENRKKFEKMNDFEENQQIDHSALFAQRCSELGLTKREIEVAEQVSLGLTSKEIAEVLYISERTVNKHLQTIYKKSDSKNRVELINSLNSNS